MLLKKAPGNTIYEFGQLISLPFNEGWDEEKLVKMNQKREKIPKLLQVNSKQNLKPSIFLIIRTMIL